MSRRRMAALAAAVLLLMLLLGLAALSPRLVDRDALARRMAADLTAIVGLPVELDAVSEIGLLPRPHAVLGPVRVLPPGGGDVRSDAPALLTAAQVRLELAWPALLLGRFEPVLLATDGLNLDWPDRAESMPRWSDALPRVRDASLRLGYPPGAERLHWRLIGAGSTPRDVAARIAEQGASVRISASLPLQRAQGPAGVLALSAAADLTEVPMLTIAPLQLTGSGLAVGELQVLAARATAEQARRDADGRWHLQGMALDAGALHIEGDAVFSRGEDGLPVGQGRLALAPLDLRAWLAPYRAVPLPGQPQTLRCIAADGPFELGGGLLTIGSAALAVDRTRAAAAATFALLGPPKAAVAARLDRLDLDPYLTAASAGAAQTASDLTPCSLLAEAAAPPPPPLPDGDDELQLDLIAEQLVLGGLSYGEIKAVVVQRGAETLADTAAGAFYGGSLSARVERLLQAAGPARYKLKVDSRGLDMGGLLTDLHGAAQVTGSADLMADLSARGADASALRGDLAGTVRIDLRDARFAALDRAATGFGPLLAAAGLPLSRDTLALSRLQVGAEGRDGLFRIADLDGRGELFRLGGGGDLDAAKATLDLDLNATLVQPADGPDLKRLAGIEVPIRVAGDLVQPRVNADLGAALGEVARRHLTNDDNVLRKLEESTGVKGLEQGLRSLFGF